MASALKSSPRAVGGALRRNPFAPEVVSPIPSEFVDIQASDCADIFHSPATAALQPTALWEASWVTGRKPRAGRIRLLSWRCWAKRASSLTRMGICAMGRGGLPSSRCEIKVSVSDFGWQERFRSDQRRRSSGSCSLVCADEVSRLISASERPLDISV